MVTLSITAYLLCQLVSLARVFAMRGCMLRPPALCSGEYLFVHHAGYKKDNNMKRTPFWRRAPLYKR
jgi:hypothetical protein